ncbi:TolC family protein [Pseudoduganella sp. LjRoot289]|uniref:TolC family protein n=1 Tax=Pseudoduganella sp. LjRoot289 TaxID=3342314 RepID=UPI003ECF68F8
MVKFLWPLAMATLVAPMHAAAQEPQAVLTLRAALALAAQANPALSAARFEVEAQDGLVLQASARPNPLLSFERIGRSGSAEADGERSYQLSQPLELGGKRAARMAAAERGRDAASAALEARRAELHADVVTAFNDVLVAQERLRLAQEANELAQRATLVANRRVAAGKVSPVDETKAKLAEAQVRLEASSASSALASARQRLASYWTQPTPRSGTPASGSNIYLESHARMTSHAANGEQAASDAHAISSGQTAGGRQAANAAGAAYMAGGAPGTLFDRVEGDIGALPALPDGAVLANWRERSLALGPARLEVARREAVTQLELANRAPDLTVSLGGKRMAAPARSQTVIGLSLPLPLFDRNQGNVLAAQRQADKAGAELAAAAVRLESELTQAVQALQSARQTVDTLRREILPAAQQATEAATKGFEFGKHNFLDVLDAQRTLLQARAQYLSTLSDGHRAAAAIERILGHSAPNNEH